MPDSSPPTPRSSRTSSPSSTTGPTAPSLRWTFAELEERANRLANVLLDLGAEPGTKVVWCGQNSPGIVAVINAARKIGVTAVPLNYRLSAEEAAYVTDHCDAIDRLRRRRVRAAVRARSATSCRRCEHILVFDGSVPDGHARRRRADGGGVARRAAEPEPPRPGPR